MGGRSFSTIARKRPIHSAAGAARRPRRSSTSSTATAALCTLLLVAILDGGRVASVRAEGNVSDYEESDDRNRVAECPADSDGDGGECSSSSSSSSIPSKKEPPRCGLYLAESSIPGAGLGIYSSVAHPEGSTVGGVSDPCMALSDFQHDTIINDYEWDAGTMGTESEGTHPVSLCPGYGMALNGHMHLHNIQLTFPDTDNGVEGDGGEVLHRSKDPGVGAFSRYHGVKGTARVDVPAGSELFLNYGESYFKDRTETLGEIPFEEDFAQNDAIASKFASFLDLHPDLTDAQSAGALNMLRDAVGGALGMSKVVGILPRTVQEARDFASNGTARSMLPESVQSAEWLEENGVCADNLREGRSKIKQAGRGAFATRPIGEGQIVAPAASLYFRDGSVFDMIGDRDDISDRQLMLNYCYGHLETTAVLFPYSPAVGYINHGDPGKANAKLRWCDSPHHKRSLLETPLEMLEDDTGYGLLMEYVALRDIDEGEEVLIDYGIEWRTAWEGHVEGWTPPENSESYVPAVEFNDRTRHTSLRNWAVMRTVDEQEGDDPYPDNILTGCYVAYFRDYADFADVGEEESDEQVRLDLTWEDESFMWRGHHYLRPCDILERHEVDKDDNEVGDETSDEGEDSSRAEEDKYVYTVQIYNLPDTVDAEKVQDFEDVIVSGVPRRAIKFMDDLYTSDQHLKGAFRHVIGLPDEMLPEAWRNRKDGGEARGG